MNLHGPDERLSAFYDGELSAVERADVERLVIERPDLRAELSVLAGLSQRLSDLADDLPEVDLRSRVMQRIAVARPASSRSPASPRSLVAPGLSLRRRLMPLLLTVSALTLLIASMWPLLPHADQAGLVANHELSDRMSAEWGNPMEPQATAPALHKTLAGETIATHDSPVTVSISPADEAGHSGTIAGGFGGGGNSANSDGTGPSELLASLERRRNLQPGDIVSRLVEGGDVPMIADYTVVDVRRTANNVEILLQEHGIVPLIPITEKETAGASHPRAKKTSDSDIKVYLVDAESASLNTALFECQKLKEVVALNVEPLGYEADAALIASQNAPPQPTAETPAPGAPATPNVSGPAKPSAAAGSAANRRVGTHPEDGVSEGSAAKNGSPNYAAQSGGPMSGRGDSKPRVSKAMSDAPRDKSKLSQIVNGNSLVVENGDQLYTEIKHRQIQGLSNADQGNAGRSQYSSKREQGQSLDKQPFTQRGQKTETAESIFRTGQKPLANGPLNNDALQYGNSSNSNGYRNRQRAIVVLHSQSPSPPDAIRINP